MFSPKKPLLTPELKDMYLLKGCNYNQMGHRTLLEKQLKNAEDYVKCSDANEILFTHVYASGNVEHGGYPESRILPFCGPTFQLAFYHSKLPYCFQICEVTDIVMPDEKLTLALSKIKIYNSLSLVLSIKYSTDLPPLLEKLEKNYIIEKLPPIIIVFNYHLQYAIIADILKKTKLGILTLIKSDKNDGVNPIGLYYKNFNTPCDKVSPTWDKLTTALNLFYNKVISPQNIEHKTHTNAMKG